MLEFVTWGHYFTHELCRVILVEIIPLHFKLLKSFTECIKTFVHIWNFVLDVANMQGNSCANKK
jgi:hypothetical protein